MNQTNDRGGLLAELLKQLNLVWKLLLDARVPASTKLLLPLMALAYVIFPIDISNRFLLIENCISPLSPGKQTCIFRITVVQYSLLFL